MTTSWRPHQVFLRPPNAHASHDEALAAWSQWCEQHAGSRCDLALSGHWLMACAALPEQALPQWDHYMGLSASAIEQAWVVRYLAAPALSCAAPRALIEGLKKTASEHRVRLEWVGPWWVWQAQGCLSSVGPEPVAQHTLHATEPGLTTYLKSSLDAGGQRTLEQAWTETSDPVGPAREPVINTPGVTTLDAGVLADALLTEWTRPDAPAWKAPWADKLDFAGPRIRTALWSWALLVAAMAACMAVAEQAQALITSQGEAQAMLHRLERAKHQQALAAAVPRAASSPAQAADRKLNDVALRQAARVAQLLAYPWPVVVGRVEQAALQEQAVLTSFSLDINSLGGKAEARPQARLQAALRDDASALRWTAAHGDGAQMLGRDALATPFASTQGHYALRAEAAWPVGVAP
ncbi:hypothetical protein [Aquabacterium sp.]|uniref:hypothetical protein n=1 Tax=Aquabacterium sp. TaxID=1872578 RepID=UPI0019BDAF15|nr:hypothetical protein [Aquabacterium sp.]MBC7702033.1 hypothetical protein [Aquabacterium sp.]